MSTGLRAVALIGGQVAVDDVGEVPLEAATGLLGGLGLVEFAPVVGLAGAGIADLADGDEMQGGVELAVAPRFSRCRRTSPLEASTGAVPL